jgi:hypothetical protein
MSVTGRWEGKLIDVTGIAAALTLDLDHSNDEARGDFSAAFLPEEDGCDPVGPRQVQTGPVRAKVDEERGTIELVCEMTIGLRPVLVAVDGRLVDANPHAKRAIVGCFDIREGVETLTLEGGGALLWEYARDRAPEGDG